MHVHAAGPGHSHGVDHAKHAQKHEHKHDKHAEKAERKDGDSFEKSKTPGIPGVVRNLLAGHYKGKGVAALRLAINHHDKIEAALNQQAQPAVEENLGELSDVVNEQVDSLLENAAPTAEQTEAIEDLREQFHLDLTDLRERFSESPDRSTIEDAVRELTDGLLSGIEAVLNPAPADETTEPTPTGETTETETPTVPAAETPAEPTTTDATEPSETPAETSGTAETPTVLDSTETPATDETTEPAEPFDLGEFLSQFRDAVGNVLSDLTDSLSSIALPAPPPPTGHGKAYAKFLAIYEQLYQPATTESVTDATEPAGVDVTA
jgi:hypothetical protein